MEDNLKYREKQAEAERCSQEIKEVNTQLGGLQAENLETQRNELIAKQETLVQEVSLLMHHLTVQ